MRGYRGDNHFIDRRVKSILNDEKSGHKELLRNILDTLELLFYKKYINEEETISLYKNIINSEYVRCEMASLFPHAWNVCEGDVDKFLKDNENWLYTLHDEFEIVDIYSQRVIIGELERYRYEKLHERLFDYCLDKDEYNEIVNILNKEWGCDYEYYRERMDDIEWKNK